MSPRKNPLLPFVKADQNGKLTYIRKIPAALRPFLGGKGTIRRTLATDSTDIASTSVLAAYARVHSEVDGLITAAKQKASSTSALITTDAAVVRPSQERFPLSKRDIAGIAGQVLLDIREAVANQQLMSAEYGRAVASLAIKAKTEGILGISLADMAVLARPVLNELSIDPSPADMSRIGQALLSYVPVMQGDMAKLAQMDFSPPRLAEVAPQAPKRQTSWRDLFLSWLQSTGGVLEQDGYGVSQKRQRPYRVAIAEFQKNLSGNPPSELTITDARGYISWLQESSGLSPRTQQGRLICLKNLLKIGVQRGLVDSNPFAELAINTPAGLSDEQGYRPFTKQELITVFETLKDEGTLHYRLVPYILIATGCRLNEAVQLRTTDIKQTEAGIWYIDWRHEPTASLPVMLKTKAKNNRCCPMHPLLVEAGLPKYQSKTATRVFTDAPSNTAFSQWFKKKLIGLEIWEKKKTVLHSIRGSARDLWRAAGMPQDYRNAITGHQSSEIGESAYGAGLRQMPDVVFKELVKIDLSWVPQEE